MIRGIGVEIVALRDLPSFHDEDICRQIWTPGELEYSLGHRSPERHLAARYAAKLATLSALGIEQANAQGKIPLIAIEIRRSALGLPYAVLQDGAADRARLLQIARWHISLTHEGLYAAAFVLAEGPEDGPPRTAGREQGLTDPFLVRQMRRASAWHRFLTDTLAEKETLYAEGNKRRHRY